MHTADFQLVPIEQLTESKLNPRRKFVAIEELAETICQHGILEPLLVRPDAQGYEVVLGARRYRAALKAGCKELPAIVREMTDNEARHAQLIENLQREGLDPLEEARAYYSLLEGGFTEEQIGERIGKHYSHVAQRLALLKLIKDAEVALLARKISTTQALMMARLQPADQKRSLEMLARWPTGGMTTRQLREWINFEVYIKLRAAPFNLKDAALLSAAGACMSCPKRTGSAPQLFSDVKAPDTCTDPTCYRAKVEAHIQSTAQRLEASGKKFLRVSSEYFNQYRDKKRLAGVLYRDDYRKIEPDSQPCATALPGLVVDGRDNLGHLLTVCAAKACRQHFRRYGRTPQDVARDGKAKLRVQINAEVKRRILAATLDKIRAPLSSADLRLVVTAWFEAAGHERRLALCKQERIEPVVVDAQGGYKDYHKGFAAYVARLDTVELHRLLLALALISHATFPLSDKESVLEKVAQQHKVDVAAIRERVTAEMGAQKS